MSKFLVRKHRREAERKKRNFRPKRLEGVLVCQRGACAWGSHEHGSAAVKQPIDSSEGVPERQRQRRGVSGSREYAACDP